MHNRSYRRFVRNSRRWLLSLMNDGFGCGAQPVPGLIIGTIDEVASQWFIAPPAYHDEGFMREYANSTSFPRFLLLASDDPEEGGSLSVPHNRAYERH
jgi:hypothetical protein